ncbi:hypothetical protein JTE90_022988 [Oedothorax gibbosus]|uniref:Uncharacterized protein n=1 Tax=Oedothorax gibbosus TaxID=931172 RepID=A0AAV6V9G6_9ARAC|nr:hypothetical protein JTE90_022988 [Oedothorax gibbosus]
MALGTFYNNVELMPKRTYKLYEHKVNHLARRFFHQLLRHHQFRKAFLLAVDIESQDLFLDLSHVAKQKGEHVLSLVAFHKANELDGSDESISSSSSYSSASAISFDKPANWDYTATSLPLRNTSAVVESAEAQVSQSLNTHNKLTFSPTVNPQPLPESYLYSVRTPVFHKSVYQDIDINKHQIDSTQLTIANSEFGTKGKHPIQVPQTAKTHTKLRLIPTVNPKPLPDPHLYSVRSSQFHKTIINQDIDANEPQNDGIQLTIKNKELETNGKYPANQVSQSFGTKNKLKFIPASNPKTLPDPHLYHARTSQFHNTVNQDISVNEPPNEIRQLTDVKSEMKTKGKYQATLVPQSSSTHNQLRFIPTVSPKPLPDPHLYSVRTPQFHKTDYQDYSTFNISSYSSSSSSHPKNGVSTVPSKLLPKLSPYSRTSGSYEGLCSDLNAVQSKQLINKYDNGNIGPINVCSNNVDEENEELEDSVIKFSHFGII